MLKNISYNKDNMNWFLYWMCERMNIFWRKYRGDAYPWTEDSILNRFSFTNVYRCLDRVSQYLISHVLYNGKHYEPEDIFFRILLFKHFNKIETWEALESKFGDITYQGGSFFEEIADYLDEVSKHETIYNSAYIICCYFYKFKEYQWMQGLSKYRAHFRVFENEIFANGHIYDFLEADSFEALYKVFHNMKIYGDFTAQQYCIDLNYSSLFNFTENDFVVTGPGSLKGISWVFENVDKKYDYIGAMRWLQENFNEIMGEFCDKSGMQWNPLPWENIPTLTNIQNCFCEISKFAKGLGVNFKKNTNERIKREYIPHGRLDYVFPPKWGECKLPDRNSDLIKNI